MISILRARSLRPINELLPLLNAEGLHATLLDPKSVSSPKQIEAAYELAMRSTKEGRAVSERIEMEFLLWLGQSPHVGKAILRVGAKKNDDMLLAVLDAKTGQAQKLAKDCGLEVSGPFEPPRLSQSEEKLLLEKMALSRLG